MAIGDIDTNVTTVEDQMTGLLSKSSPYMKVARTGAKKQAASRGLLNSSIAAGAGEDAAIKNALPIAGQDAGAYNAMDTQVYQQKATEDLLGQETGYKSDLMTQEAEQDSDLLAQDFTQQRTLYDDQYDYNTQLKEMEFTSDEIQAIGSSTTLLGDTLSNNITDIQRDASLGADAKTEIVAQLNAMYQSQINSIGAIYGVPIEWT